MEASQQKCRFKKEGAITYVINSPALRGCGSCEAWQQMQCMPMHQANENNMQEL